MLRILLSVSPQIGNNMDMLLRLTAAMTLSLLTSAMARAQIEYLSQSRQISGFVNLGGESGALSAPNAFPWDQTLTLAGGPGGGAASIRQVSRLEPEGIFFEAFPQTTRPAANTGVATVNAQARVDFMLPTRQRFRLVGRVPEVGGNPPANTSPLRQVRLSGSDVDIFLHGDWVNEDPPNGPGAFSFSGVLGPGEYTFFVGGTSTSSAGGNFEIAGRFYAELRFSALCDADVNQDGAADQNDVETLVDVVSGGENPLNVDPDFNADGFADQLDVSDLINVAAGGACP